MLLDILKPRVTELGSIRIGKKGEARKSQSGGEYRLPQKLDHFIITKLARDDRTDDLIVDKALMDSLCEQGFADPDGHLRRIPIRVLSNDPEDIMQAAYCWYAGKKCAARSDGRTVTFFQGWTREDWLKPLPEPIVKQWDEDMIDWKDGRGEKLFKIHTVFNCMIASKDAKFGGVYKFRTTSQITGSQLLGGLTQVLQLTNGILVGMPLQLVIRPIQVNPETSKGKITSKVYIVHVELVGSDLKALQAQAMEQARWMLESSSVTKKTMAEYQRVLRAPGDEIDPAEIASIQEEFHPEHTEEEQKFPMPEAVEPEGEPPPPVETPPEPTPVETKKRGRKKKPAPEATPTPEPEPPPTDEKPDEPTPSEPKNNPAMEEFYQKELTRFLSAIDNCRTLEELSAANVKGTEMFTFYELMKSQGRTDITKQLIERGKNQKLGIYRRMIDDEYNDRKWNDKDIVALAAKLGITDVNEMTAPQAEKLLAEMIEQRKTT